MNNRNKKTYNNKCERKSYYETSSKRSSDGKFHLATTITELCNCCTRNELYITAFRVGIRKDYNIDTLLAIFYNSLSVRHYAMSIINDIEANLASASKWENECVNWYKSNISDIRHFLDNFDTYVSDDANVIVPHFSFYF